MSFLWFKPPLVRWIVIDPIAIPLVQRAQLHISIKPHGDLSLALLLSRFDTVFIQGGNPLAQMPHSSKVEREFAHVPFKVYFGLYDNATSRASDLVIPAQTFLEKNDFRLSYGDFTFQTMPQLRVSFLGISEYGLTQVLCDAFGFPLEEEVVYLDHFTAHIEVHEGVEYKKVRPCIPYEAGFATRSQKFEFMEEVEVNVGKGEGFCLLTTKSPHSLNSQFRREANAFFHPTCGFREGEWVKMSNNVGEVTLMVQYDAKIRHDCVLIYSGTPMVNHLTPAQLSYEGQSAIYQEFNVKVTSL